MPPEPFRVAAIVEKPHEHIDDLVDRTDTNMPRLLILVGDVLRDFLQRGLAESGADGVGLDAAHAPPEEVLDLLSF